MDKTKNNRFIKYLGMFFGAFAFGCILWVSVSICNAVLANGNQIKLSEPQKPVSTMTSSDLVLNTFPWMGNLPEIKKNRGLNEAVTLGKQTITITGAEIAYGTDTFQLMDANTGKIVPYHNGVKSNELYLAPNGELVILDVTVSGDDAGDLWFPNSNHIRLFKTDHFEVPISYVKQLTSNTGKWYFYLVQGDSKPDAYYLYFEIAGLRSGDDSNSKIFMYKDSSELFEIPASSMNVITKK